MKNVKRFLKSVLKQKNDLVPLSSWANDGGEITVTIHCFVYNQEKYISRCLDSFLSQLVNFNVEILVHDDCSSDGSKAIIGEYYKKYPNIIKPIFEEKNVYSKTGNFLEIAEMLNNQSKGKFIAICEGDDYWIDPLKLFLQASVLDNFSNCSFCVHRVKVSSDDSNYELKDNFIPSFKMTTKFLNDKRFISIIHDGYSFQTSSYFFRKSDYDALLEKKPQYMRLMPTDDEVIIRHFGSLGDTCFIDRTMSTYLQFTAGSWSKEHKDKKNDTKRSQYLRAVNEFDIYTKYKYAASCKKMILKTEVFSLMDSKKYDEIFKSKELRKTLRKIDRKTYISLRIRRLFGKTK